MGINEINKLGNCINKIKKRCDSDTNWFLNNLPKSMDIIQSKRVKGDLIFYDDYIKHRKIFEDIINRKNRAWGEMIKLIEEFAIKEQNKNKKPEKKKVVKKSKRRAKKK